MQEMPRLNKAENGERWSGDRVYSRWSRDLVAYDQVARGREKVQSFLYKDRALSLFFKNVQKKGNFKWLNEVGNPLLPKRL